ncbi:MAG: type II toxin-antitoxin system PemK/MazF family toxin [Candidatus Altimarinota bacterium]
MVKQGDIYWVEFSPSTGSEMRGVHPALILQQSLINQTGIRTVVVVAMSSNTDLKHIPGNVLIPAKKSGLKKDSVVNVSHMYTLDKSRLERKAGQLHQEDMDLVFEGIDHLFGR